MKGSRIFAAGRRVAISAAAALSALSIAAAADAGSAVAVIDGASLGGLAAASVEARGVAAAGARGIAAARAAADSAGASDVQVYRALSAVSGHVFALFTSDEKDGDALASALNSDPTVISAASSSKKHVMHVPNDPEYSKMWNMPAIGMEKAWDKTKGRSDVYVAVIDTGIDSSHPDLAGRVDPAYSYDFIKKRAGGGSDGHGHGTHVAGTVAATGDNGKAVVGVCPKGVKLIDLRILDDKGVGDNIDMIAAIDHVVALLSGNPTKSLPHPPATPPNIAAVNLSLGGYESITPSKAKLTGDPGWLAVNALSKLDKAVIVVAAGNEGMETGAPLTVDVKDVGSKGQYTYPASYIGLEKDNMIVVSAIASDDTAPSFTNWGSNAVDISAPGVAILSTRAGSTKTDSGTSMATPHVSGAAALIMSMMLDGGKAPLSASEVKLRIAAAANDKKDPKNLHASVPAQFSTDKSISKYGMLNVERALEIAVSSDTEITKDDKFTPQDVTLKQQSMPPVVGDSFRVVPAVVPPSAAGNVVLSNWKSSNRNVATVDSDGNVIAVGAGTTTITADVSMSSKVISGRGALPSSISVDVTIAEKPAPPVRTSSGGGGGGCATAGLLLVIPLAAFALTRKRAA